MPYELESYHVSNPSWSGRFFEAPIHITIDPSFVQEDECGKKVVPANTWWLGPRDAARPLPRTRFVSGVMTAQKSFTVDNAAFFQVSEVLAAAAPWAHVNLGNPGWAVGETITLTIDGYDFVYTIVTVPTSHEELAISVVEAINADLYLSRIIKALTYDDSGFFDIFIYALSIGSSLPIAVATNSAAGTLSITGGLTQLQPYAELGEIAAIDLETNTITLTTLAAKAFPPGYPIGVATSEKILGISRVEIDLSEPGNLNQGIYDDANIQREAIPYIDADIEKQFPQITLT